MLAYADETGEALGGELRPGNAGANTAADQIAVAGQALEQIPAEHIEQIELLLRVDTAGATHELLDWAREGRIRYSVGCDLSDAVRAAIIQTGARHLTKTAVSGATGRSSRSPNSSTSPGGRRARA